MRFFKFIALPFLAATLTACAQQEPPRLYHAGLAEDYQYGEFDYAAHRRDIKLDVVGYPFSAQETRKSFARIIETWMWGKNRGPKAHFTVNLGPSHRVPYSVVMVFNAKSPLSPRELCRATETNPAILPVNGNGIVNIQAAFCRGDKPLSVSSASKEGLYSPLDESFGQMISDTAYVLFPRPTSAK